MVQSRWKNFVHIPVVLLLHYSYFLTTGYALASSESGLSDVQVDSRELAGLAQKWNLTSTGVDFQGMNFQLNYLTSDFIVDSMLDAVAYSTPECQDEGSIVPEGDMSMSIIVDDTPAGVGDFERNLLVNVTVNPGNIEDSSIYTTIYDEDGKEQARVEFCMRFSLYTNGDTPIEVNYLETIVGFTADLTAGFVIDVAVQPKDRLIETALQTYEVDAYKCDDNNVPLSAIALARAMNQGEVIRVCVTPNQEARDQGIYLKALESFTYYRDYGGTIGLVTQVAIEDSREASNFLTVLSCTAGSIVCNFETVLYADMFLSPGFVDGTGTALLQIGPDPERRRVESQSSLRSPRLLQGDDGAEAISQFDLDFQLRLGEQFNGILKTSSSSVTNVFFSFVAIGTMVSLNLLL